MIHLNNNPSGTPRKYRMTLRSHNGFPQCVALIDLLFLLLLFTAMSTQVIRISGIRVDLPRADAPQESILGKLIVTIIPGEDGNECRYFFRDREIKLDELQQIFSQQTERHKKTVIIRADRNIPQGVIYELTAGIHEAGMAVLIASQPLKSKPEMRFE